MDFISLAPPLLKAFWYIAIFASVIFAVMLAISFFGGGDFDHAAGFDADLDASHGGGDFQVFSFRNIVNFLLGFSWAGIGLYGLVASKPILIVIALAVGAAMVNIVYQLMRALVQLGRDQTVKPESAVGKIGQVYLSIPAHRSGKGKILISLGGATREFDAMTDNNAISNGKHIVVLEALNDNLMLVSEPEDELV